MEESREQGTRVEPRSGEVWREFLGRAPLFTEADFEELCRRHPDLAESLRKLREGASSGRFEGEQPFVERLRRLAEPVQRGARLVREDVIAQGGMGVVRRVRDVELNR